MSPFLRRKCLKVLRGKDGVVFAAGNLPELSQEKIANARNICIIGSPGAGKTTLAKQLARQLQVTAVSMDDIAEQQFRKGLGMPTEARWQELLKGAAADDRVITEGNYWCSIPHRFAAADVIVVMAPPMATCLWRAFVRGAQNLVGETTAHPSTRLSMLSRIQYFLSPKIYFRAVLFWVLHRHDLLAAVLARPSDTPVVVIASSRERGTSLIGQPLVHR